MLGIISLVYQGRTFTNSNRIQSSVNEMLIAHRIVRKDFAKDEPFIGPVGEQPQSWF
jgi:hypothetical protein